MEDGGIEPLSVTVSKQKAHKAEGVLNLEHPQPSFRSKFGTRAWELNPHTDCF